MIVILESPYAGDVARNLHYARRAMRDCIIRGETPFASHLLYAQAGILDDRIPHERQRGIDAGYEFWKMADKMVAYTDYGISVGMKRAIELWSVGGKQFEIRKIGKADSWFCRLLKTAGF